MRSRLNSHTAIFACLLIAFLSQPSRGQSQSARSSRSDCGLHCLYASIITLQPGSTRLVNLAQELGPPRSEGYSLLELQTVAEKHGFKTLGVKATTASLRARPDRYTCIAAVDGNHFVLVTNIQSGVVSMIDSGKVVEIEEEVFSKRWSGEALLISLEVLTPEADIAVEGAARTAIFGAVSTLAAALVAAIVWKKYYS